MGSSPGAGPQGPPPLALRALGRLTLEVGEEPATDLLAQPKRLGLFLFLALARRGHTARRDEVLSMFWPDLGEGPARAALSQALSVLRRSLGEDRILTRGATDVGVREDGVQCDVFDFERALDQGDLAAAATLYQGPLLPGFGIPGTEGFDDWLDRDRARLRRRYLEALESLARSAEAGPSPDKARDWWERLVAVDPLSDQYAAALIRSLALAGERTAALRHGERHAKRLEAALGISPGPDVLAALAEARTRTAAPAGPPRPKPVLVGSSPQPESEPRAELLPVPGTHLPRWLVPALAALVLLGIGLVAQLTRPRRDERTAPPDARILVTSFVERSQHQELRGLGELAAGWIVDGLVRVDGLAVIDPSSALAISRDNRRGLSLEPAPESLASIGRANRAEQIVSGVVEDEGDSVALSAKVVDVREARVLASVRVVSTPERAATEGVRSLRDRIVGILASSHNAAIKSLGGPRLTPPSLSAYRLYVEGLEIFQQGDDAGSLPLFLRSARTDTTFLLPIVWALYAAGNAAMAVAAPTSYRRTADSLVVVIKRLLPSVRERASPLEWLMLAIEKEQSDSNPVLVNAYVAAAARLAPGSNFSFELGKIEAYRGRWSQAVKELERIDLQQGWARGWYPTVNLAAVANHMVGRHDHELALTRLGVRDAPGSILYRSYELGALAALGWMTEFWGVLRSAEALPDPEGDYYNLVRVYRLAGLELLAHGRPVEARKVLPLALHYAAQHPDRLLPDDEAFLAEVAMALGDWKAAEVWLLAHIDKARQSSGTIPPVSLGELGLVYARLGRTDEARAILTRLATATTLPGRSSLPHALWQGPVSAAIVSDALGMPDRALDLIERIPGTVDHGFARSDFYGWDLLHAIPLSDAVRSSPRFLRVISRP